MDDTVGLEMTVTSEFTLVGCCNEDDDHIPDADILEKYVVESSDVMLDVLEIGRKQDKAILDTAQNSRSNGKFAVEEILQTYK